ncbi:hypothetical protein [Cellulomonas aerilata]|uniref:hypothetical protein n=1 Tax=Cellulomonas aerilata TaxID=515326 RepID=UPI0011BD57D6|nr:hypothetical protein [Cellulomonas aerilata]
MSELTKTRRSVTHDALRKSLSKSAASPLYPHSDVETYANNVFMSGPEGVYQGALGTKVDYDFARVLDAPALRVAASYRRLAVAAGSEGLLEKPLATRRRDYEGDDSRLLSERYAQSCSWARFDVVASSHRGDLGYLVAFTKPERDRTAPDEGRDLIGVVNARALFDRPRGYMFAAGDQLILVHESGVDLESWNPFRRREGYGADVERSVVGRRTFSRKGFTQGVLDAGGSVFGIVVEHDNDLEVLASDGTSKRLPEPVNWRCFPRSARYVNHLHVTYDDHVRIYAYVHDYFLRGERGPATGKPKQVVLA